jgi:hypothetical protein
MQRLGWPDNQRQFLLRHAELPTASLCVLEGVAYGINRMDTRFAYGIGAQVKLATFAIRAEYERIAAMGGDPDLFSFGLSWSY